ncbi:MAG: peptidoglycan editing factor PgeF [Candidatus Paracaedibacteraceae bacterium]|nr:peptidoglycan editing factor PgeF [Candidatus Paracaedibacteraceae bacterium]
MVVSLRSPLLAKIPSISHAFTTRQGGVSKGLFSTLNAAMEKGDNPADVLENRRRIAEHVGGSLDQLITLRQTHSNKVIVATDTWLHADRPEGDALITRSKNLIIGIITADCVPVLLADKETGMIAAVHAGWKGATSNIIPNTIQTMKNLGAAANKIVAAIGPCIWQESYEVDQAFYENLPDDHKFFIPSPKESHWMFDLPGYVEQQLKVSGITQICPSPYNTYEEEDLFFSNRRRMHRQESTFGCTLSCIKLAY